MGNQEPAAASLIDMMQSIAGNMPGNFAGGYGWKDDPFSQPLLASSTFINGFQSRGWVAGGHVGYNWQYAAIVGGLELDVSATGIKGNSSTAVLTQQGTIFAESFGNDVKLLGTARGRLGWAPSSDWLLYGTGGLAWERGDRTFVFTQTTPTNVSTQFGSSPMDLFGWVAGAGVEARLMGSNWIGRLEYLHYNLGHTGDSFSAVNTNPLQPNTTQTAGNQTIDVVRAGLSYKFGN